MKYSEGEGADFQLVRARDNCGGTTQTIYMIDPRFDADAKHGELEISTAAWIQFRKALIEAGVEGLTDRKFDESKATVFWSFYVEYPDVTFRSASADVPTTVQEFAAVRKALRELTNGKVF